MKKIKTTLCILALSGLLTMSASFAGNEGGGGGGVCTPSRCMTLAQAGLRIDVARTEEFELELEVVSEVHRIVKLIPASADKKKFIASVIGNRKTFVLLNTNEDRRFKKFKDEYLSILRSTSMGTKEVELLAFSEKGTTYLLPGYELLDTTGKALLLIHEKLIRDNNVTVLNALTFDGLLLDLLTAINEGRYQTFDAWPLIQLLNSLGLIEDWMATEDYLRDIFRKNNNRMYFGDLFDPNLEGSDIGQRLSISRSYALGLKKFHPDAAKKLTEKEVLLFRVFASRALSKDVSSNLGDAGETIRRLCKEDPSISGFLTFIPDKTEDDHFLVLVYCD